jgi:hypothetical protein
MEVVMAAPSVCQTYLPPHILKRKKRGFAANVVDEWALLHQRQAGNAPGRTSLMFELLRPEPVLKSYELAIPATR